MSAAVPRTKNSKQGTSEFTQRSHTNLKEEPEAAPVIEIARVAGTHLGSISQHGMTPLMRAACDGSAGTVQALLDRGADVNAKRSDGFNALALAAFFGHSQVVWLLLENGADLSVTGRYQTPPDMWADIRGFLDVGDILREARTTRQEEVKNSPAAAIEEPARFPRPAEQEKVKPAEDPAPTVPAVNVIDEVIDSPTSFQMKAGGVVEEGTTTRSQSTAEIVPPESVGQANQPPAITQTLRAPKTLPEIKDPLPLLVPEFHPGSVFVARINSSRTTLVALILALLLVGGGIAAFLVPQIKSLASWRTDNVQKPTNLPSARDVPSGTNVSAETPPAATTESTIAPASKDNDVTAGTAAGSQPPESTYPVGSTEVSGKDSTNVEPARESESLAHSGSSPSGNSRRFSAAASTSRSAATPRKHRTSSGAVVKQETTSEEQPKPAPLSVEASRTRSVVSQPVRSAKEPGSQPPPLSIISNKPKSKVIQWP